MSQAHPLKIDEDIMKMCEDGRISLGKASLVLHKSIYELQRAAKQKGIRLGLTAKEYEHSKKLADKLSS